MNKCLNCGKDVKNKYCNVSCQNTHRCTGKKLTQEHIDKMLFTRNGKWKTFNVKCCKCDKVFEIKEFDTDKPKKEKYHCSSKCSHSRQQTEETRKKISATSSKSEKVKNANIESGKLRRGHYYGGNENAKNKKIERVISKCLHCGEDIEHKITEVRKYHSECWLKHSGGFREGSSNGKSGWYKGYWCDSSWELAWVIYSLEHNIKFERNKKGFEYYFEDKTSLFYPDFIVDSKYVEVKNYNSSRLEAKLKYFPHEITVLYKEDLKNVFDYVIGNYGKKYIELYEIKN